MKRVLARLFGIEGWPGLPKVEKQLWTIAARLLPEARLADYTQAQMDFGATLCTRADPACAACPLREACVAHREGRTAELPHPKPGKPLPEREARMLLVEDDRGRVLLQRRPPTGVWAALWSLPEHADAAASRDWFDQHLAGDFARAEVLAPVLHGFTHYRLRILPMRVAGVRPRDAVGDNPGLRWASRAELQAIGLPAPVRRLLEDG